MDTKISHPNQPPPFIKPAWVADGYNPPSQMTVSTKIFNAPVVTKKLGCDESKRTSSRPTSAYSAREQEARVYMATLQKQQQEEVEGYGPKYFFYTADGAEKKKQQRPWSAPSNRDHVQLEFTRAKLGYATFTYMPPSAPQHLGFVGKAMSGPKVSFKERRRPASAVVKGSVNGKPPMPPDRPKSATNRPVSKGRVMTGPTTSSTINRQPGDLRKSYTLISRTYEEENFIHQTHTSTCPDQGYMDRHARCFDHTHVHKQLIRNRPQRVCDYSSADCYQQLQLSQQDAAEISIRCSSAFGYNQNDGDFMKNFEDHMELPHERYTNALRPKSAPGGIRGGFVRYGNTPRGTVPHFCNFVKKVRLSEKEHEQKQADHSHLRHRPEADDTAQPRNTTDSMQAGSRRSQTGSDGTGGRPGSPASDTSSHGRDRRGDRDSWPQVEEASHSDDSVDDLHTGCNTTVVDIPVVHPVTPPPSNIDSDDSPEKKVTKIPLDNSSGLSDKHLLSDNKNTTEENNKPEVDNLPKADDKNNKHPSDQNLNTNTTQKTEIKAPPLPQTTGNTSQPNKNSTQSSPYPHQNVPLKKPRAPVVKKERKQVERTRSEKPEETEVEKMPEPEVKEEIKEEPKQPEPPPLPTLEVKPPDLPTLPRKELPPRRGLSAKRAPREGIKFVSPVCDFSGDKEALDNIKEQRKAFELNIPAMEKEKYDQSRQSSWLLGRLALSQQSARFELPMDMKTLEEMSGIDYLKKHCVISQRRQNLYQAVFNRYRDKTGNITAKEFDKALQEVLVNTITKSDIDNICKLVGLSNEFTVDFKLFGGLAAMAERILYPKFVTDDTADLKQYNKEKIECADFSALDWKLHGLHVNPQVRTILKSL